MAENLGCWDAPLSSVEEDLTSWHVPIQSEDEAPKHRNVPLQYENRYDTDFCSNLYDQKFGVLLDKKFEPTTLGNNEHDLGINSGTTDVSELYFKDNVLSISLNVAPFDAGKPNFETGKTWIAIWFEQEFKDGESLDHTVSMKLWRKYIYPENYEHQGLDFSVDGKNIRLKLSLQKPSDSHDKDASHQTVLKSSSQAEKENNSAENFPDEEFIQKSLEETKEINEGLQKLDKNIDSKDDVDISKNSGTNTKPVPDVPKQAQESRNLRSKNRSREEHSEDASSKAGAKSEDSKKGSGKKKSKEESKLLKEKADVSNPDKPRESKRIAAAAIAGSSIAKTATPKKKPPSETTDSPAKKNPKPKPSK